MLLIIRLTEYTWLGLPVYDEKGWFTEKHVIIKMVALRKESTKTTSMEDVSTGVLETIKNIYEVKIKPKNDMQYQDIYNCICQNTKKWRYTIHNVKPTAQ